MDRCGQQRLVHELDCAYRRGSDPAADLSDAITPSAASTANPANNHRAGVASPVSVRFTATPASPAPKAPHINWTVLMAAAAAGPSAGSSTHVIAHADRCGHAMPTPVPVISSATAHTATSPTGASSNWVSAPIASPVAITNGATATVRTIIRLLLSEALLISPMVQPMARPAPRKPAASGVRWASR